MENTEFKKIFGELAKANGFESAFSGWFQESDECIVVLELQKSNYANYYYLNFKIFIQGIFGIKYLRGKNLVKKEMGDVFKRQPNDFSDALNLDSHIDVEKRKERLSILFDEFIVPLTRKSLTKLDIKELAKQGELFLLPAVKKELEK